MRNYLLAIIFGINIVNSVFAQNLTGEYKRPYGCASCMEFLHLNGDGTYKRVVAFDWGDNNYKGKWKILNNKLILTEKDTLLKGFYWNKKFSIVKRNSALILKPKGNAYIPESQSNSYYIFPLE